MNAKPLIRLIKKEERQGPKIQAKREIAGGPNRWSRSVLSWVSEFQQHRRIESLTAFESLFKAPRSQAEVEISLTEPAMDQTFMRSDAARDRNNGDCWSGSP